MRSILGAIFILIFAIGCGKKSTNSPDQPEQRAGVSGNNQIGSPLPLAASAPSGDTYTNDMGMQFVRVPKGTLWGLQGQQDIPNDFYIGVYEVTQEEWKAVTGKNPSYFSASGKGAAQLAGVPPEDLKRFPVESISWLNAQDFVAQLNTKQKLTGWCYRLPTQREWEYAALGAEQDKAKAHHRFHFKSGPTDKLTTRQANFGTIEWLRLENLPGSLGRTCRVGSYEPNKLGLYDLHGNVCEWCEDIHTPGSQDRVQCGGAFISTETECAAGNRGRGDHTTRPRADDGLRVVLAPVAEAFPPPGGKQEPNPAPVVKPEPEISKLTATSFMNLLKTDKQAGTRYKQKWFQIEGTIAELDNEHKIMTLTGTKAANVLGFFIGAGQTDFARFKVGQKVTIRGIFSSINASGHAQLLKCEVVK